MEDAETPLQRLKDAVGFAFQRVEPGEEVSSNKCLVLCELMQKM